MYIKKYIYQIDVEKKEEFRDVVYRAHEIYKQYIDYKIIIAKSEKCPGDIEEIHIYESEQKYNEAQEKINKRQEIQDLYNRLLNILTKEKPSIVEQTYTDIITNI